MPLNVTLEPCVPSALVHVFPKFLCSSTLFSTGLSLAKASIHAMETSLWARDLFILAPNEFI